MRELLVETRREAGENGIDCSFDYYILVDEMKVDGGFACESYGVKGVQTGGGEEEAVPNITTSITRIDALMELLTRNFVTPATLKDVIMDWL